MSAKQAKIDNQNKPQPSPLSEADAADQGDCWQTILVVATAHQQKGACDRKGCASALKEAVFLTATMLG